MFFLDKEKTELLVNKNNFFSQKPTAIAYIFFVILFIWFWGIKPLYLNEKLVRAQNLTAEKENCQQSFGIANGQDWSRSGILLPYAAITYSDIVRSCAFIEPQKEVEYSQKTASLLKMATDIQPKFSRHWVFLASYTNVLAAREQDADKKSDYLLQSENYLKQAVKLSPTRQEGYVELQKIYLLKQDYQSMEKVGKDCIAIDARYGECYWSLGVSQIFLNKISEGKENITKALENYSNPPYKQLAVAYLSNEHWQDALLSYEKIPEPDQTSPDRASYFANLALIYNQVKEYDKAGKAALEVFKLQPENPETFQFIQLLLVKNPNNPTLNATMAYILKEPGPNQNIEKSKAIYLSLIKNYPAELEYRWELAHAYYNENDYARAYQEIAILISRGFNKAEEIDNFMKTFPNEYFAQYLKIRD